ncbi:MAG TPA: hypothetical protein VMA86_07035, partial [Acetobacteraceae bacterium]|nr:hypothetical protein [Acetobacteraceae bacterium]
QAYYYHKKGEIFFRIAAAGLFPHAEALAFKQKNVADAVVDALNAMHADGSLAALFAKYHACVLSAPYRITTGPMSPPHCAPGTD